MSDLEVELTAPNGVKYTQPLGLFINNEFVKPKNGGTIESINPTDESPICKVFAADADDVDTAVAAARKAFKSWRDVPGTERQRLMNKFADLLDQHKETLATIETWDNGKPYKNALNTDLNFTISTIRYYAGWADKQYGQTIQTDDTKKLTYTLREPVGVCGQIIPWNFPLIMAAWKLGPALACGNVVVLKAAEQTPLSILYAAKLIKEAGFPPGVVNILNGYGKEAGAALASHMDVDKIAFTGSTITGKAIMKMAASNMKSITLETGGKSPLIVFDDADLDQAVKWSHAGIFINMGQACTATSRIFVHKNIYDDFIAQFKERIKNVSVIGDPFKDDTFQGPQVTKQQFERVMGYIEAGKSEGATLAAGGNAWKNLNGKGFFVEPTIFTNVQEHMKIYREEVFGPFVCISQFETEDEVLAKANDTTYGLGSAVFTKDLQKAHRVARGIEAGMVWVNSSQDSDFRIPFGGLKQSGIGKELGQAGLAAYTVEKAVHVNMGTVLP